MIKQCNNVNTITQDSNNNIHSDEFKYKQPQEIY